MTQNNTNPVPKWFYFVVFFALVWNILGVAAYVMQVTMTPEALAALPEAERALYENMPAWATSAFALAVNGGAFGCFLLLLKKNFSIWFLEISLVGVLVQMFHSFFMANAYEVYGPGGVSMPILVVLISVYLVYLSRSAKANGWTS